MKPTVITKTCKLPDGREITIETGKLARQADGSVVVPDALRPYMDGAAVIRKR